jgi:hypothetical protein
MRSLLAIVVVLFCIGLGPVGSAVEPASDGIGNYVAVIHVAAKPESRDGVDGFAIFRMVGDRFSLTEWMAKPDFEKQFFKISETSGEDAGKITEETVDRFITSVETEQAGNRGTVSVASTVIGFDAVKPATIAETYAFDLVGSSKVSEARARANVWEMLGFVKQWAENGIAPKPVSEAESTPVTVE